MVQQEEKVGIYNEFCEKILLCIVKEGYNCIQIMVIQEYLYYGSFGYYVLSFFVVLFCFGILEEFKQLIDIVYGLGIVVIMDIVYLYVVKNEVEGLGNFVGDLN